MHIRTVPFPIDETFAMRRCLVSPNRSIASLQLFSSNASSICNKREKVRIYKNYPVTKILYYLVGLSSYLAVSLKITFPFYLKIIIICFPI